MESDLDILANVGESQSCFKTNIVIIANKLNEIANKKIQRTNEAHFIVAIFLFQFV